MRVIAGTHRHRLLLSPPGADVTRPITDRVKQSLFDRLTAMGVFGMVGGDEDGGGENGGGASQPEPVAALDIFAGTGSMGIEALSRGSAACTFIERDRRIRQILDENLTKLELVDRSQVLGVDAIGAGWMTLLAHRPVGVVFCDPPYALMEEEASRLRVLAMLQGVAAAGFLAEGAVLVLRTPAAIEVPAIEGWGEADGRRIGSMRLAYFVRA